MNPMMQAYFRKRLLDWKADLLDSSQTSLVQLAEDQLKTPELSDRAASETNKAVEFRARDRARKLINKIDQALQRLDDGSYGYCEETEEKISTKRLIARPVATLTVEAQAEKERNERLHRR